MLVSANGIQAVLLAPVATCFIIDPVALMLESNLMGTCAKLQANKRDGTVCLRPAKHAYRQNFFREFQKTILSNCNTNIVVNVH